MRVHEEEDRIMHEDVLPERFDVRLRLRNRCERDRVPGIDMLRLQPFAF